MKKIYQYSEDEQKLIDLMFRTLLKDLHQSQIMSRPSLIDGNTMEKIKEMLRGG